jgi:threonine aldolase
MIDLRSDTVTKPTAKMLEAMLKAEVGDDVYGEDPTANRLEEKVAKLLGKEDSIFVPSGTMANLLSLIVHTQPGGEVILDRNSHVFVNEGGGGAAICGVQSFLLEGDRGILDPLKIEQAVRDPGNYHHPVTSLIWIENTHNRGVGSIYPPDLVKQISGVAKKRNLPLHMDGARLLNATVALGIDPKEYTRWVDSTSLCLSKGLGAPVGSVVAGDREFIKRARRFRKMLGGGMRQIGYLAAAGIYALDHHVERLAEDHANARLLAKALAQLGCFEIDPNNVETNILYFKVVEGKLNPGSLQDELRKNGVLIHQVGSNFFRAVTHLDVSRQDILKVISILKHLVP